jgi:succinate dehydrogenase / fumarate reductase cytochrome b subunit
MDKPVMRSYRYRWGEGMWSHLFHRVSGLALILYLSMHIWVENHIQKGQAAYDALMRLLDTFPFKVGEAFLLAAILFHSINGMRLVVMDSGIGIRKQRASFWLVFAICAMLGIAGGIVIVFFGD